MKSLLHSPDLAALILRLALASIFVTQGGLKLRHDGGTAYRARVRELILEKEGPSLKPWGCYEFAVSDPDGTLVRIGRVAS